ncbi:MAG: cytochrome P450 [Novosphingobium sp.]
MTFPALAIDPFDEQFLADPFAHHAALRDAGPVVRLERYGCYAMARYAEVQPALKDFETYVSGRGVGLSDFAQEEPWRPPSLLLESDPPLHDRTRGLMNKIASLGSLKLAAPRWAEIAQDIVAAALANGRVDAVESLGEAFPLAVFPELIGLREDGRENLIPYGTSAFNAFGPRNRILEQALADAEKYSGWIAEACKRENLKPGGWGMQVHEGADRGDCTPQEAERLVRSFLTAGVDTTVNGISALVHALAQNPDQYALLRADRSLIKRAVEETLRWAGIVQTFFRTTSRAVALPEGTIPEGSKVLLFLASANRDPRKWADPDRFDVTRVASGHVGFGFGIHQCLGQMVARMEMEAILTALLDQVATIRPTGPAQGRINNTLNALRSVPVELAPA